MNLSYKEKSIWTSLVLSILIFGYYFYHVIRVFNTPDPHPKLIIGNFIVTIFFFVIIQIISQVYIAIKHRKEIEKGEDERDTLINLKATRVSYLILVIGVWLTCISMIKFSSSIIIANNIMFFFILSEVVRFTSQLIYYRRSLIWVNVISKITYENFVLIMVK